jgi:hypothetical protein
MRGVGNLDTGRHGGLPLLPAFALRADSAIVDS